MTIAVDWEVKPLTKQNNGIGSHIVFFQGSHRFKKYFNIEGFLETSLKIKSALKSMGKLH